MLHILNTRPGRRRGAVNWTQPSPEWIAPLVLTRTNFPFIGRYLLKDFPGRDFAAAIQCPFNPFTFHLESYKQTFRLHYSSRNPPFSRRIPPRTRR